MLSTGGVGYVEYAADIDGPMALGLDVPLGQIDDFLKSFVAFDTAGGIAGIELPGRDPDLGDLAIPATPLETLNALRGVPLTVTGRNPMSGSLLSAEKFQIEKAGERTRVTLLTADGLRQFVLEDAEAVQVADPVLRARIARALAAGRRDANEGSRHVTLRGSGSGARTVRVGYVAGMALWKTSYRLVLPANDAAKGRLQGWAVVENATGADWNSVQLALQYGNPVTFRQALYHTYFVDRPDVPVEILGRLLPALDTRAAEVTDEDAAKPAYRGLRRDLARAMPPPSPPAGVAAANPTPMQEMAAPAVETLAAEGAEETVFVLPTPVILQAGHTASVPILDREIPVERMGLIQTNAKHPLASVKLINQTQTSLPAGALTLYDPTSPAAFAGDARLAGLPVGESRLLSFAEDLRTNVTWKTQDSTIVAAVSAGGGMLRVDQRLRTSYTVVIAGPAGEPRKLLLELAKRPGAVLTPETGGKPSEETTSAWRIPLTLAAGQSQTVVAHVDRIQRQQVALLQDDRMILYVMNSQALDAPARAALQRIMDLRAAETGRIAERERARAQIGEIEREEKRIRDNLSAVPTGDALHARLMRQLDAAETRMDGVNKAIEQANAAVDTAHKALVAGVEALKI